MKTTKLLLFTLLVTAVAYAQSDVPQGKIDAAFGQSFATQQNELEPIISELKQDETANAYWIAYAQFRSGIFYLQLGQNDQAARVVDEAIELLQGIEEKNSEEHALLGTILGFKISLEPSSAANLSVKAAAQYRSALKKNEDNMRAYLGLGESDFHKPAAYGGGKKVEEYLLKAIALPEQSTENGASWGKNRAYHILSSFYLREGKPDKAKMYCIQGLNKYPGDFQLNELKKSL